MTTNGAIRDYAERLRHELSLPLGLELDRGHYTPLNLSYSRTLIPNAAYGHRHRFSIRQGDGFIDRWLGDKVLEGIYFEKLVSGSGKREIVICIPSHSGIIKPIIEKVNGEFGLDFVVGEIEREEAFHRAKAVLAV